MALSHDDSTINIVLYINIISSIKANYKQKKASGKVNKLTSNLYSAKIYNVSRAH